MKLLSAFSPRRLAVRAFIFGIVVLGGVFASFAGTGWLAREVRGSIDDEKTVDSLRALGSAAALRERAPDLVRQLPRTHLFQLSIYSLDGKLVASSQTPPLRAFIPLMPSLPEHVIGFSQGHDTDEIYNLTHAGQSFGYVVEETHETQLPGHWLATAIALLVVVMVMVSLGLAWTLNRPLNRLAATARAVGEGDFSRRTGLTGSDEISEVGRAFDGMTQKLEALFRAERELLAGASHELRTPLARMTVALDLAELGDAERTTRALAEARRSVLELQTIVDDLLTVTRLELAQGPATSASYAQRRVSTDVGELVQDTLAGARGRHPSRTVELTGGVSLGHAELDARLFARALANLLDNALKYSDGAVTVHAARASDLISLTVEDHGIGMNPEDLRRVFTPFFRADSSRTQSTGGVGMGLLLAKRIVEANGGSITVESEEGRGTRVRVTLPGEPGDQPETRGPSRP